MRFILCLFGVAVLFSSVQGQQPSGRVEGTVVDDDGKPVANVMVYPLAEHASYVGISPVASTDEGGRFFLSGLSAGTNRLFPVLTAKGYPDGRSGIFAGDPSLYSVVEVQPGKTVSGIVLKLPKKGARLTLEIVDSETGESVLAARVHITRPDLDWAFYDSSPNPKGQFEIVLPKLSFRIEVRAPGYETWRFFEPGVDSKGTFDLILEPGTRRVITVSLKKLPPPKP